MNLDMGLKKWQGVEIFCREKGETAGYLEEGKIASYDFPYTMDLRAYDGIEVVVGAANRSDLWLDVVLEPLGSGRPEFIRQTRASICIPRSGGGVRIPFSAFDHSVLVSAHMKYISRVKLLLRKDEEKTAFWSSPARLQIESPGFYMADSFRAKALWASRAGDAGETLTWQVRLENDSEEEILLAASEIRQGRESFSLNFEKKILLKAQEVRNVNISAVLPDKIAPGGFEMRQMQWNPCGMNLPGQSVKLYAGRKGVHPFLLHRGDGWAHLKKLVREDVLLAQRFKEEYEEKALAFAVPKPAADESFVFISETQDDFLKTAVAWKVTEKKEYLEKLLFYFKGFLDKECGYLSTRYPYFQFIRSKKEWEKGIAGDSSGKDGSCPFAVHRACSAGWVQEAEFMTKLAFVYDLFYEREEFTPWMHREMELCMRSYMEFTDWRLSDGDGNNFQLAEACASLYFACLLSDYPLIGRFLSGKNGIYDLIGAVFSDDGSYFEGATNYVRLAAEILLHCANSCENYGLNLKDVLVPASFDDHILHAPWAKRQEWAKDHKPFLGMSFERFEPNQRPVRRLKDFTDQLTTLLTPEGILFSVNDSNEQSLIPIMDLAYFLYLDPAYCVFSDEEQAGDFLFGKHMADWKKQNRKERQGNGKDSVLVRGGGFAILREKTGEDCICQAVMKYGQHGGYHGHYDRLSLVSFLRDNQTFHNQEFAWFGYDSFLFKMWVQASIAHNMVVVDRKMQEPTPCECIYFAKEEHFSAVCAQTLCRWSDPPYGGQTPYPIQFPEEKCRKEGRYILVPPIPREQGEIGEYTEPVFMRRLCVLAKGILFVWDYLKAEELHDFDCLYHPFGSVEISGMRYRESEERFDDDPFGAAQFVTCCHWFDTEGTVSLSFSNKQKRVNTNDRIDFVENSHLFGIYPLKGEAMVGKYPFKTDDFQNVWKHNAVDLLKDPCKKTVSFHQKGTCARFVTALEIGQKESSIRHIQSEAYGSIIIYKKDGSVGRLTVKGMDEWEQKQVEVIYQTGR